MHHDTLAVTVPVPEESDHAVLACSTGIHEEHYVSEAVLVEDVLDPREYRDAGTITGMLSAICALL